MASTPPCSFRQILQPQSSPERRVSKLLRKNQPQFTAGFAKGPPSGGPSALRAILEISKARRAPRHFWSFVTGQTGVHFPFSTVLCESCFSHMIQIKNAYRNRMTAENLENLMHLTLNKGREINYTNIAIKLAKKHDFWMLNYLCNSGVMNDR